MIAICNDAAKDFIPIWSALICSPYSCGELVGLYNWLSPVHRGTIPKAVPHEQKNIILEEKSKWAYLISSEFQPNTLTDQMNRYLILLRIMHKEKVDVISLL